MHSFLRKKIPFELIGTPLIADHLYRLMEREKQVGLELDDWVSGDYSAATDNLKIHYTRAAFEVFLEHSECSENSKQLLRSVLYEHEVHYGPQMVKINEELIKLNPELTSLKPFVQQTGQLMGSVLSFPILNVCNFIAYWISLERYFGEEIRDWKSLPVLCNGDDILFHTNTDHYEHWKQCIKEVGFELSMGKNYVHESLMTVNSKLFYEKKQSSMGFKNQGQLTEVNFYNVGLLFGNSKVCDNREASVKKKVSSSKNNYEVPDCPFSSEYNCVIEGSTNKERAHKMFIHYHKDSVEKYTDKGRISLSLPLHLGGLGCNVPESVGYLTEAQTRVAMFLSDRIRQLEDVTRIYNFSTNLPNKAAVTVFERTVSGVHFGFGPLHEGMAKHEDITKSYTNTFAEQETTLMFRSIDRRQFFNLCQQSRSKTELIEICPMFLRKASEPNSESSPLRS
jgi:hypothetical protein